MAVGRELLLAGVIAGGAVVGVGVGVATGGPEGVPVLASVSTFDCPAGAVVGDLHSGDRILATGRDDSGDWLEVRAPNDQGGRVWVEARYVTPDAETADLDVRSCDEQGEVAFAPNADVPAADITTTTGGDGGSSGGGSSGGGGGSAPDTTGPTITSASVTPGEIYETDATTGCAEQASVAASATDPSGIASLTASWTSPVSQTKNIPAIFGPFAAYTIPVNTQQTVTITITARDGAGNVSTTTRQVVLTSFGLCNA
jgi:hypothetical protein